MQQYRHIRHFVALLATCCMPGATMAYERAFPDTVQRATMSSLANYPTILLDKKTYTLAVGARIWNQANLIQMPATIDGTRFTVNYTTDIHGQVDRVWILTPEEAGKPRKKPP